MPQVEVAFDIDANGIVNVSAKDKATGKEQQIRIQASGGLSDDDIERMVQDAEENAADDQKRRELVEARNQADSTIHATEKTLSDFGDKVSEAERKTIEDAIGDLKTAMEGEDIADITARLEALQQASMKLGEAVYKAQQEAEEQGAEGGDGNSTGPGNNNDDVVDADFEEVDDQDRNKSA
jgi:molecular chaperone DnaK